MEKIVYLLGAGFSAPLGLPLMNNFVVKSKDLHDAHPKKYSYFEKIIDEFDSLAKTKNYYHSDLFNIEEVLSILEMSKVIKDEISLFNNVLGDPTDDLLKYLKDVVVHYTPDFKPYQGIMPSNYHELLFGKNNPYKYYCFFLASIFQLLYKRNEKNRPNGHFYFLKDTDHQYSIITLNYDRVLENVTNHFDNNSDETISFKTQFGSNDNFWSKKPYLSKIHGSVDTEIIVPPTWNKQLEERVRKLWSDAFQILTSANQIRIIGYSLPESDAYVKYLLKAASISTRNLKQIDVICMDHDDIVKNRYKNFITLNSSDFKNISINAYFDKIYELTIREKYEEKMEFNKLEVAHNQFFGRL